MRADGKLVSAAVAPRAGARIETRLRPSRPSACSGRSPRGSADRNFFRLREVRRLNGRSPRGSADRNNACATFCAAGVMSLPARERGSKPASAFADSSRIWSLPARERGSKRFGFGARMSSPTVAPRAGARIETVARRTVCVVARVAPRAGARIETHTRSTRSALRSRRSPRGSADRNPYAPVDFVRAPRSLPARERGSKL